MLTLRVYSGPRGFFKSHVDTPRSENQFASLVVCLPSAHEGGALVFRHNNRSIDFDWSGPASDMIQWAAFYSDCEHEVMPLTSGHRITLTYNLFYQVTQPQPGHTVLPVHSFPIYHDLQAALLNPGFLKPGGILGFYRNHSYPHSNERLRKGVPAALKGIDLLVYAVCRSLGLRTKARPILNLESEFDNSLDELSASDYEDYSRENFATKIHQKSRNRLGDSQKDGFHIPLYKRKHMKSSHGYFIDSENDNDVLPEYKNTTGDPTKYPLAQHDLTLEYRKFDREARMQLDSYAPTEPDAKIEYLKSNVEVDGLVPPSEAAPVRVGSKFHEVKKLEYQMMEDEVRPSLALWSCLQTSAQSNNADTVFPTCRHSNMFGPATESPASTGSQK
jgi:2OG-Fe(II) oxygenase superfamily